MQAMPLGSKLFLRVVEAVLDQLNYLDGVAPSTAIDQYKTVGSNCTQKWRLKEQKKKPYKTGTGQGK